MSKLNGATITWLGHAAVLIETAKGSRILVDPFLSANPKFPKGFRLPEKIDLMLVTHGHSDHIADAVPVAKKSNPTIVAMVEVANWLGKQGAAKTTGMNLGGTVQVGDVAVTMVDAKHSSTMDDGAAGVYGGSPVGFVIAPEGGPVLYHAGDTCAFSDMKLIRELHAPQLAMLPIGGHYTMGPKEAALAVELLGVKTVLPIHFGTWPVLAGRPEDLERELAARNLADVEVLRVEPGQPIR